MKKCFYVIPVLLLLGCGCGSSNKSVQSVSNQSDTVGEVQAKEQNAPASESNVGAAIASNSEEGDGEIFTISMKANPSTGYKWFWVNKADAAADSVECKFVAGTGSPMMMGAGGKVEWSFKTKAVGCDSLVFHYARSFENGVEPADTYVYHIKKK